MIVILLKDENKYIKKNPIIVTIATVISNLKPRFIIAKE